MRLFSPAKLNLFFRVLRKREDGYHEIATLMQACDLGDWLTISLAPRTLIETTNETLPTDRSNLIYRSLELFNYKTNNSVSMHCHIEKNIPIGAGLGGGSSNAATTLWALNQLTNAGLSNETLMEWSSQLGADVPFFFSQGSAYCTGFGEKVENLSDFSPFKGTLFMPKEKLSTPRVFRVCRPNEVTQRDPLELLKERAFVNDLEPGAFRLVPRLRNLKKTLNSHGVTQLSMTGSGSTFFCEGEHPELSLPDITIKPFQTLDRKEDHWYLP